MRPTLGINVAAPAELAWQELIELGNWPEWGPTVSAARVENDSSRVFDGARGAVQTALGVWLPFQVERWDDDGPRRTWSWRVAGVPATTHSVITKATSECRVEMSVPWWASGYLAVVALALVRIRRRVEARTRA